MTADIADPTEGIIRTMALSMKVAAESFSNPVHLYVEGEWHHRNDPDGDYEVSQEEGALRSWEILVVAAASPLLEELLRRQVREPDWEAAYKGSLETIDRLNAVIRELSK